MPARFADRISGAQRAMALSDLDILVVTNRENLIYFTGV
ncbi:MAG: aminopeptidase P family N-terminal domain-containing protein, partial [Syntrophobacteraceae bacterium]